MTKAYKYNEFYDSRYLEKFNEDVRRIRSGEVSIDEIRARLNLMEARIDEWAEDSEFFDLKLAQTLLGRSESILQTLSSYPEEVRWELLGAVLYFVDEADVIPDNSICGFDDDEIVMETILKKHNIKLV